MKFIKKILLFYILIINNVGLYSQDFCPETIYPTLNTMQLHFKSQSISIEGNTLLNGNIRVYAVKYNPDEDTTKCLGKAIYQGGDPMTLSINGKDDFAFGYNKGDTIKLVFELDNFCLSDSSILSNPIIFKQDTLKELEAVDVIKGDCIFTKTNEYNELDLLKVFPNPCYDKIQVVARFSQNTSGKIEIFSILGKRIKDIRFEGNEIMENINLNMHNNGIYILKISSDKAFLAKRLIIKR